MPSLSRRFRLPFNQICREKPGILKVVLVTFLFMVFSHGFVCAVQQDRTVNSDVMISGFDTIVMEQGKSHVRPEFRVKNTGSRPYVSVKLQYNRVTGLDRFGKDVYLPFNTNFSISTTLEPGEEKALIAGDRFMSNLTTTFKQEKTTYETECWFEFADKAGNLYRSPNHKIRGFIRVIDGNEDITLVDYRPVVLTQGEKDVCPVFRLKNRGNRTYTSVLLKCDRPLGKYETGRSDYLYIRINRQKKLRLEPGEEVTLVPEKHPVSYISARDNQSLGLYSVKYNFELIDSEGCVYTTPYTEIEEFARVMPK